MVIRPTSMLLLLLLLPGCLAPGPRDRRGILPSARRVLELDLGTRASGPRLKRLERAPQGLAAELHRADGLAAQLPTGADELGRAGGIAARGAGLLSAEVQRQPLANAAALWPTRRDLAQDTADDLDELLLLLGGTRRPLGEIDDRVHRTDHLDDRPEASWWQRLRRRLRP